MTVEFSLIACDIDDLTGLENIAEAEGWDEVVASVRDERQYRILNEWDDRPGSTEVLDD